MSEASDKSKKIVNGTKPKFALPDPNISLEKHLELIKAYVILSKNGKEGVTYKSFKSLVELSPTIISGNNAFFKEIGIINEVEKQRGAYIPTEPAVRLNTALRWKRDSEIESILSELLRDAWFWNFAKQLLELKEKASRAELKEKLGFESNADPKKHNVSLNVLIDYMLKAGLIIEREGNITLKNKGMGEVASKPPHTGGVDTLQSKQKAESVVLDRDHIKQQFSVLIGVLVTPEMSEEQVRRTIRIILSEIKGANL